MKELFVRALSGAIYVFILLGSIFLSELSFFILFSILGIICLNEFLKLIHLKSIVLYGVLLLFIALFSVVQFDLYATKLLLILTGFINLFLLKDLLWVNMIPMYQKKKYAVTILYLICGFVFITLIPFYNNVYSPHLIASVFILIWANDIFAFLIGKYFGKRKLFERISPKKTIAGFVGGMIACIVASFFIFKYLAIFSPIFWIGLALLISFLGPVGDLIQSKFKRQAGVKDSGNLIPGHGGVYDRLDSILYAAPFIYTYIILTDYVS
ncbi:phosphatidate cytidylyltransferase [Planktosalinus lacus]|uniref:Phosphatidate cytidylyltransferase n=1 Tax=Planktosalinus lacus TaxID=1526573 RepID=A0A8J2Y9J7_9FLAO|nr:phosphatidate cytidylyltransferase [Planktosalinus lacus]GGD88930.1 phosphatidate cytidylyltransferase [Planktosalinus lacus]